MDKDKQLPDYQNFLRAVEYSPDEVEKYFAKLVESLEKELFSLENKRDIRLKDTYSEYEGQVEKYDDLKADVLKKYFEEYKEINNKNEAEISQLENEYYAKRAELVDRIQAEKELINKIKYNRLMELYEKKKEPASRIMAVVQKTDKEYEKHSETIFKAKETILKNNSEFYQNAESHLSAIRNTTRFLVELADYSKNLKDNVASLSIESSLQTVDIYVQYLHDEKKKVTDIDLLKNKYTILEECFKNIKKDIEIRENKIMEDVLKIKSEISLKLASFDKNKTQIISHFDKKISEEKDEKIKTVLLSQKEASLKKVDIDKERLAVESSTEIDFLNRQKESLSSFSHSLSSFDTGIKSSYTSQLEKNAKMISDTFEVLEEILSDQRQSIIRFKDDAGDSREILAYFERRYQISDLSAKAKTLEEYQNYIIKNVEDNKKLDVLAFQLLTNEELLKLKLLDLQKEFLTIDDEVKIKQITYDVELEELKETMNPTLIIKNAENEIDLLVKDFEIDKKIKKNELKSALYILDLRKKIDIMRCDYMSAYARLENVEKVVGAKSENQNEITDISSQIELQKILELVLLESISRKSEYETIIKNYNAQIENLDVNAKQRLRYLNNVLEIERDNFEAKKNKLNSTYEDLKKTVYPEMISVKKTAGIKIKEIKRSFSESKKKEIDERNSIIDKINKSEKIIRHSLSESKKKVASIIPERSKNPSLFTANIDRDVLVSSLSSLIFDFLLIVNDEIEKMGDKNLKKVYAKIKSNDYFFSSFKEKIKNTSESKDRAFLFLLLKKSADRELDQIYIKYEKQINKIRPDSDDELNNVLSEYDNTMKHLIAMEVINTSSSLDPYFDDIKKFEEAKEKVYAQLENDISEYKKSYLSTVKAVENEYDEKLGKLKDLKQTTANKKDSGNKDLEEIIENTFVSLSERKNEKIRKNDEENSIYQKKAANTVSALSEQIKHVNDRFDQEQQKSEESNAEYLKKMGFEARNAYMASEVNKSKNAEALKKQEQEKTSGRSKYFENVTIDSMKVKEQYQEKKKNLETEIESDKLDKTVEYGKLFNNVKESSLNALNTLSEPVTSFEKEIEKFSSDMLQKVDELTNTMTGEVNASFDIAISKIDELKNNLNGRVE